MSEESLRKAMVVLAEYLKEDHKYSVMLGNELAALRDALQDLSDGKFKPIFEKHLAKMKTKTKQAEEDVIADYDELIRQIKSGQ
jgi:hypothetical protein